MGCFESKPAGDVLLDKVTIKVMNEQLPTYHTSVAPSIKSGSVQVARNWSIGISLFLCITFFFGGLYFLLTRPVSDAQNFDLMTFVTTYGDNNTIGFFLVNEPYGHESEHIRMYSTSTGERLKIIHDNSNDRKHDYFMPLNVALEKDLFYGQNGGFIVEMCYPRDGEENADPESWSDCIRGQTHQFTAPNGLKQTVDDWITQQEKDEAVDDWVAQKYDTPQVIYDSEESDGLQIY
eukprot:328329_1